MLYEDEFYPLLDGYSEKELKKLCYKLVCCSHAASQLRYGGKATREDFLKHAEWMIDSDKFYAKYYNRCPKCHSKGYSKVIKEGYLDEETKKWVEAVLETCVSCGGTGKFDNSKGELNV